MLFFGIDPDTHSMAYSFVRETLEIAWVGVIRVSQKLSGADAIAAMCHELSLANLGPFIADIEGENQVMAAAVEAQEVYSNKNGKQARNPQATICLANAAGAGMLMTAVYFPNAELYIPSPKQWKGQVDKIAHHAKIFTAANQPFEEVILKSKQSRMGMPVRNGYCRPLRLEAGTSDGTINPGDWLHLADATGLAQYAAKTWKFEQGKSKKA